MRTQSFMVGKIKRRLFDNPAPYVYPNGTVLLMFSWRPKRLCVAVGRDGWKGRFKIVGGPLWPERVAYGQDAFLYANQRGIHCLFHGFPWANTSLAGRHAFSRNGIDWTLSETPAYSSTVRFANGSSVTYVRRERPHLVFDARGDPIALVNGVCEKGDDVDDFTFTLVQPIRHQSR